jgi:hypothetical protein
VRISTVPWHARLKANAGSPERQVVMAPLGQGTWPGSANARRPRIACSATGRLGSKHRHYVRLRSERGRVVIPVSPRENAVTAQIVDLAHYRSSIVRKDDRVSSASRPASGQAAAHAGETGCRPRLCALEARTPRSEPRHEIEGWCSPRLTLNGKAAVVRNVSRHGLMASVNICAAPGSRVLAIIAGSRPISARVVWQERDLVGLDLPVNWPAAVV